jgi:hypothetical protein
VLFLYWLIVFPAGTAGLMMAFKTGIDPVGCFSCH